MADFALEQVETNEDLMLDYKMGNMDTQEAYDNGFLDELGREVYGNKLVTCKHCGQGGLVWLRTDKGWRTSEKGEVHNCPAFKKAK